MRRWVIAVSVLVFLPSSTQAETSRDEWHHLFLDVAHLEPGQNLTYTLTTSMEEGPFRKDWILTFFVSVQANGSGVRLEARYQGAAFDSWNLGAGDSHQLSTRLPGDVGPYQVVISNPSATQRATYAFYFDQSCSCTYKVIPVNEGFVLFNYDQPADRQVTVGFPLVAGWEVRGTVSQLEGSAGHWPEDFSPLVESTARGPDWLRLSFRTSDADRYYVFVEALQGASPNAPIELTVDVQSTPVKKSPAFGVSFFVLTLAGLLALRRRLAQ